MSRKAERDPVARFLHARIDDGWMPSAVWCVEREGVPLSEGALGAAVVEPRSVPASWTTPYDLASLTKPLCTALLLALAGERGEVDAEAPVGDVVDELRGSAFAPASLIDLARHTSGMAAWRPLYLFARDLEGYLARIGSEAPAVPAGTPLYSDLGYIVLGAALERVCAEPLDRLFRRRVAEPLGLSRLGFARKGCFPDAAATERGNAYERALAGSPRPGHPWREGVIRGEAHDGNAHGLGGVAAHAGLFGTAREVAAVAREILFPRRLALGPKARRLLLEPAAGGRTVGFVVADHAGAARGILPPGSPGHTGFTGTSLWLDPSGGAIHVLLTNRVHPRVPERGFVWLRRGFHRLAAARCRAR